MSIDRVGIGAGVGAAAVRTMHNLAITRHHHNATGICPAFDTDDLSCPGAESIAATSVGTRTEFQTHYNIEENGKLERPDCCYKSPRKLQDLGARILKTESMSTHHNPHRILTNTPTFTADLSETAAPPYPPSTPSVH